MRRFLVSSLSPALVAAVLALAAPGAATAEDAALQRIASEGTQAISTGASEATAPARRNLNTVPEDGEPQNALGPNNAFVRELLAARPNEDLIICVAGCSNDRDRVVYAQPAEKITLKHTTN
jgi:hypothetical protein